MTLGTRLVAVTCTVAVTGACAPGSGDVRADPGTAVVIGRGTAPQPGPSASEPARSATGPATSSSPAVPAPTDFAVQAALPPVRHTDAAAELEIAAQAGDGRTVNVGEVMVSTGPGFVGIFTRAGALLGSARVTSTSRPVTVRLRTPVPASGTLRAVLFHDNGDGVLNTARDPAINNGDRSPSRRLALLDEDFRYTVR